MHPHAHGSTLEASNAVMSWHNSYASALPAVTHLLLLVQLLHLHHLLLLHRKILSIARQPSCRLHGARRSASSCWHSMLQRQGSKGAEVKQLCTVANSSVTKGKPCHEVKQHPGRMITAAAAAKPKK
jgi:hypothetical protein